MNAIEFTISAGGLTILLIEGIKYIVRLIKKDMTFALPTWFYALFTPVSNALMPFILVALGITSTDPILSMGVVGVVQYLLRIIIATLITFVGYNDGIKPLKTYNAEQAALKAAKE